MSASGPAGQDGGGSKDSNKKAKKDLEVSAYEREREKQKAAEKAKKQAEANVEMGLGKSSNIKNQFTDLTKENLNPQEDNYQENKLENYKIKDSNAPGLFGSILNLTKGARQKSFEVNRDYYQKNVVGKGNYKNTFEDYEKYIKGRGAGTLDAMGRTISNQGGNDNNNQPAIVQKNVGGKTVQTTEAKVEEDKAKSEKEYDARQTKKKGRRKNILTSARGVTKATADYSLGKKTLLGQVV